MSSTVKPKDVVELFGVNVRFGEVTKKARTSSVECKDISIQTYREICLLLKAELEKKLEPSRMKDLYTFIPLFDEAKLENCHFTPSLSWTGKDVLDWFALIGFVPQKPSGDYDRLLNGKALLMGDTNALFPKEDWKALDLKYRGYVKRLENITPITLRDISKSSSLNKKAFFDSHFCPLPYSGQDFMAVVKEIVKGRPHLPPGHSEVVVPDIEYFSPYTTLLQSSCTGKTRFLLEPIKEDEDSRSLVVYFTMCSNLDVYVGNVFLMKLLNAMEKFDLETCAIYFAYVYRKIIEVLSDDDGTLKDDFSTKGGYFADTILKKMNPPLCDEPPTREVDDDPFKEIVTKAQGNTPSKTVYVVIAIDEAHELLDFKRLNHPSLALPENFDKYKKASQPQTKGKITKKASQAARELAKDNLKKQQEDLDRKGTKFKTLCIDDLEEESDLRISYFTILRRTGRFCNLGFSLKIPVILTSTNSRLSNFMPNINYDASRRFLIESSSTAVPTYLHRPMILQETMDVWSRQLTIKESYPDYLRSSKFVENLFLHGRPYWGSLLQVGERRFPGSYKAVYELAKMKLTAVSPTISDDVDALALLGQTLLIEPITTAEYGSKLIEARMGFLKMVDVFSHHYFVAAVYPEPVLALVATQILFKSKGNTLVQCLSRFSKMTEIGVANVGADGEFVVRTAFYVARMIASPVPGVDFKSKVLQPARPRFLEDVLGSLASLSSVVEKVLGEEFLKSLISFTHWIKLDSLLRVEGEVKVPMCFEYVLQQALTRSSALVMPDRTFGVDLVIPLVTQSGELGAVLLQVKNYQENKGVTQCEAFEKMALFAKRNNLINRCVYMLAFTSPKKETKKATISQLHGNSLNALLRYLGTDPKKPSKSADVKLPCLVMRGLNFSFREKDDKNSDHELKVPKANLGHLRTLLADLADMYRDAGNRFVPKFGTYYQRDEEIFESPEVAQNVVELPVAAQTVETPKVEASEKGVKRRRKYSK